MEKSESGAGASQKNRGNEGGVQYGKGIAGIREHIQAIVPEYLDETGIEMDSDAEVG